MPGRIIHRNKQSTPLALMNTAAAELQHRLGMQQFSYFGWAANRFNQKKSR